MSKRLGRGLDALIPSLSVNDDDKVIEISALKSLALNPSLLASFSNAWEALGTYMKSDFRRQLLQFVEAPKDTRDNTPSTPYLQLRHVEVPPGNFKGYRKWRDETIFDVVRNAEEVEVFLAYHSVISNEPGVMFLSGFSNSVDAYQSVFNSERYKNIVQQAGDQYITGGQNGLYTRLYRLVS